MQRRDMLFSLAGLCLFPQQGDTHCYPPGKPATIHMNSSIEAGGYSQLCMFCDATVITLASELYVLTWHTGMLRMCHTHLSELKSHIDAMVV